MASNREDILVDLSTGNYLVQNGDFVIGDSRAQEAISIVRASQNEYKHYPLVGCNSATWNNAIISKQAAMRIIKRQLEADGLQSNDFEMIFNG
jgi:predicted Zn-dependent protease